MLPEYKLLSQVGVGCFKIEKNHFFTYERKQNHSEFTNFALAVILMRGAEMLIYQSYNPNSFTAIFQVILFNSAQLTVE
jgi:hypothetical protein